MFNKQSSADQSTFQGFPGDSCRGSFRRKFEEAFGNKGAQYWTRRWERHFANHKAANISETDEAYTLSLYAAGLHKEHFSLSVSGQVLTVSYNATPSQGISYIYQEYEPVSFERSFQLNEKVLIDSISAAYTDGVLHVTLPKDPAAHQPVQEVKVN